MLRAGGDVRTVTSYSAPKVAVNMAPVPGAVMSWVAPPPALQEASAYRDFGPKYCGLGAVIVWIVPGLQDRVTGAVNCLPSTPTLRPDRAASTRYATGRSSF